MTGVVNDGEGEHGMVRERSGLFRKVAIEHVSSPEELNDYIKVTTPGVWTVLIAVIVLLAALFFWGAYGSIEVTRSVSGELVTEWVTPFSLLFD